MIRTASAALILLGLVACGQVEGPAHVASSAEGGSELRIREVADAKGLMVGALLSSQDLGNEALLELYRTQVNAVTVTAYWFQIAQQEGVYDFSTADPVVRFAVDNGLRVRGHVLFWHVLNPAHLEQRELTREDAIALLYEHADVVIGHFEENFPGVIEQWDVVNEAVDNDGTRRDSVWRRAIGDDWVHHAFLATRAALDSRGRAAVKLFYNDYFDLGMAAGAEATALLPGTNFDDGDLVPVAAGGAAGPLPCEAIVKCRGVQLLVSELLERGTPIDGVGFQAHLASPTPADFRQLTAWVGPLGLEWAATELDVPVPQGSAQYAQDHQANGFANVAGACAADPACSTVVTWGMTDAHTWFNQLAGGALGEALHFDAQLQPKPAAFAYQNALTSPGRQ